MPNFEDERSQGQRREYIASGSCSNSKKNRVFDDNNTVPRAIKAFYSHAALIIKASD